jgi:hypothetical protein
MRLWLEPLEDRTVLSTVSIGSTGGLLYAASSGAANNVTISWDGAHTYTIADSAEKIYTSGLFALLQCSGRGTNTLTVNSNSVEYTTIGPKGNIITAYTPGVASMDFDLGDQNNQVTLESNGVPISINNTKGGTDAVVLGSAGASGSSTLANIQGNVSVANPSGASSLAIYDGGDSGSHLVSMYAGSITGLAPATISWTANAPGSATGGVNSLRVYGNSPSASPSNFWNIYGTSNLSQGTYVLTASGSSGAETGVDVWGTSGPLSIDGGNNPQYVDIGTGPGTGGLSMANINGSVDVYDSGASGVTSLYLSDSGDTAGHTVSMYDGHITGLAPAPIYWSPTASTGGVVGLSVVGSSGNNTWNVYGTSNFGTSTSRMPHSWEVQGSTGIGSDGNNDVINVWATSDTLGIGTYTSTVGGDTVTIGSGGTLANIHGAVYVEGSTNTPEGYPNLIINDSGDTASKTATLTGGSVNGQGTITLGSLTGLAPAPIEWMPFIGYNIGGVASLSIACGSGNDTVTVASMPLTATSTTLNGGGGTNTLVGPNQSDNWVVNAANGGTMLGGAVQFANFQHLVGGKGVDTFQFGTAGHVLSIDGGGAPGGQGDWLDYSAFPSTSPVTVNLATGSATGVNGGAVGAVKNIQDVLGGAGNDTLTGNSLGNILIGNGGNDTIYGGSGRSLLIGGGGGDKIIGGSADDILISGTTNYDRNQTALMLILKEWQRTDKTYSQRISDLKNGGGYNGTNKLIWGTTVQDDAAADTLTGGAGLDWFFANRGPSGVVDKITDLNNGGTEQVN